jgi:hypothetical protein
MAQPRAADEQTPLLRNMSKNPEAHTSNLVSDDGRERDSGPEDAPEGQIVQAYGDSRKIGVTGAIFLILNKMIGTGSELHPIPEFILAFVKPLLRSLFDTLWYLCGHRLGWSLFDLVACW